MKVKANLYGFITLSTRNKDEAKFLNTLWERGHILIFAKNRKRVGGITEIQFGESFKNSWRRK